MQVQATFLALNRLERATLAVVMLVAGVLEQGVIAWRLP